MLSLGHLAVRAVTTKFRYVRSGAAAEQEVNTFTTPAKLRRFYNSVRLVCALALFGLQLATRSELPVCFHQPFTYVLGVIYVCDFLSMHTVNNLSYSLQLYIAFLTLFTVLRPNSATGDWHVALTFLATWFVFAYRDFWPLATYTSSQEDGYEGPILWVKLAALTVGAVVVPFIRPRRYVPYDPIVSRFKTKVVRTQVHSAQNPSKTPSEEQTASILSRIVYTYMDRFIFTTSRKTSITTEELPVLADSDDIKNLTHRAYGV